MLMALHTASWSLKISHQRAQSWWGCTWGKGLWRITVKEIIQIALHTTLTLSVSCVAWPIDAVSGVSVTLHKSAKPPHNGLKRAAASQQCDLVMGPLVLSPPVSTHLYQAPASPAVPPLWGNTITSVQQVLGMDAKIKALLSKFPKFGLRMASSCPYPPPDSALWCTTLGTPPHPIIQETVSPTDAAMSLAT